jgi:hypothetical protein
MWWNSGGRVLSTSACSTEQKRSKGQKRIEEKIVPNESIYV